MAVEVIFPMLGLSEGTGTVVKWLKAEGDEVQKGEILAEIESEKVVTELESPCSGILKIILAPEDLEVATLAVIAVITAVGEELPEKYLKEKVNIGSISKSMVKPEPEFAVAGCGQSSTKVIAVPLVRKLAMEHNIEITSIKGTGQGGRISKEDVLRAIEEKKSLPKETAAIPGELTGEKVLPLSPMRKVIAQRMSQSFQSPHFYLTVHVDTQELMHVLKFLKGDPETSPTVTDMLIKIAAKAVGKNPLINCSYVDNSVKVFKQINIGLVTAVEGGLVVVVIREANKRSLEDICKIKNDLVQKARERKISKEDMSGSTFTISNLGMFGIDQFSAILQPPEAAILAVGRIVDQAVVRDGQIVPRPMMTLTLSIDHRVIDGVIGANFLQSLKSYIENPTKLLL